MTEPPFLSLEDVLDIHKEMLRHFGGNDGIRDVGMLASAVAMPQSTYDGKFLHDFPFGMAAAYAYHLAENQPFIDGNKRTALAAALLFLEICGVPLDDPEERLYEAMLNIARHGLSKTDLEALFIKLANK